MCDVCGKEDNDSLQDFRTYQGGLVDGGAPARGPEVSYGVSADAAEAVAEPRTEDELDAGRRDLDKCRRTPSQSLPCVSLLRSSAVTSSQPTEKRQKYAANPEKVTTIAVPIMLLYDAVHCCWTASVVGRAVPMTSYKFQ